MHDHHDQTESGHPHAHGHHHAHHHAPSANADRRYLTLALVLLLAFMAAEVVVGVLAQSLALISDAGHMLSDAAAIGLALFAMRMARRPAQGRYTFGYRRVEILSAQANGITLLLLALWFTIEAIQRLLDPPAVQGLWVLGTAIVGALVNLLLVWVMAKADRRSLNIEGSFQHILTDLYAFIATAIAGAVVWLTGWNRADAIASLVVAALMLRAGLALVREAGRVFMEAAPRDIDPTEVRESILAVSGVTRLADLHVWEVTSGMPALSAHLFVSKAQDCHDKRREVAHMLQQRYRIDHVTLQTDHAEADSHADRALPCAHCSGS
ncbi:MAG TPA: cation diffusion facilitator family transporter [Rhodanobacteraceae bacterium]|nr:cation diffusion facilitator family transporter [Rhodanobacteraceae bacterium]